MTSATVTQTTENGVITQQPSVRNFLTQIFCSLRLPRRLIHSSIYQAMALRLKGQLQRDNSGGEMNESDDWPHAIDFVKLPPLCASAVPSASL